LCDAQQPEAEETTELANTRIAFSPIPACGPDRKPDLVTGRHSVHRLQEQIQVEPEFQLPNGHHGPVLAQADQVAAADLAFDLVTEALEKPLDRRIERGLEAWAGVGAGACHALSI